MNRQLLTALLAITTLAGAAHAADIPKSLETIGIKIGDTQQQVEKVLFASLTFAHTLLMDRMLKCDKSVTVAIVGDSTWATAISVTIVDFDAAVKNLMPIAAAAAKEKQDAIDAAKKAPAPKL